MPTSQYSSQLIKQLYAKVLYPPELTKLMANVNVWRKFCELPTDIKIKFAFPDHQVGIKDPGYKERERAKGREDKWYFHYTGENHKILQECGLLYFVAQTPVVKDFFDFSAQAYQKAQALALEIAQDLENVAPGLSQEIEKGKEGMIMRFLYYVPQSAQDMSLADAHIDRGGFTLHLFESELGLELMNFQEQWIPAPMGDGHTIVFAGWQLEQKTNNVVRATWHRVRRIPGVNDQRPRISVVFFVPFVNSKWYPMDDRFQSLKPGYSR